ncbi:unnamed protein product [Leuciscus chuanchicus]
MDDIETTYLNLIGSEVLETHVSAFSRKWLKERILTDLPHLVYVRPNRKKPAVLYSPDACEEDMVTTTMTAGKEEDNSMKTIYKAAQVIRKSIATFTKTKERNVIKVSSDIGDVPAEIRTLIYWIMVGPAEKLQTEKKTRVVDRATLTVSQNIMYGLKFCAQVKYMPSSESASFRSPQARENPRVLGLALTVHHDTRNEKLMNLLNAHGYSVSHDRALLMETALTNAVVENIKAHQGLYVPPFLKKGTFVFFAVDNTDFAEDTPDGKGTTHGTSTAVYQKVDPSKEPVAEPLIIGDAQSLSVTPFYGALEACGKVSLLEVFTKTATVKVGPDKPLEGVRLTALQARKTLLVPTPRLRTGLFNRIIPPKGATKQELRVCSTSQLHTEVLKKIPILKTLRTLEQEAGKDVALKTTPARADGTKKSKELKWQPDCYPKAELQCECLASEGDKCAAFERKFPNSPVTTVYLSDFPAGLHASELKSLLREQEAVPL